MTAALALATPDEQAFDWRNPQYASIIKDRMRRLQTIREQPELIGHLKRVYRDQPWLFISDFGTTSDPRHVEIGLPVTIPFILFPRQIEWCQWLMERWRAREPGVTVKSRDMGITWLSVAMTTTMCMFYDDMAVGFGSRKLELVDALGDPKCIFWKARLFIEKVPPEFSGNWTTREKLISFENGSTIAGEGGDDIGRGARAQPLDEPVLTPSGFRPMGDLKVGDQVIGANGQATRVTGVYPQGYKETFRVSFNDGSSTRCCADHLWQVTTSAMRKSKKRKPVKPRSKSHAVLPLWVIMSGLVKDRPDGQTEYVYQVPMLSAPIQFDANEYPLDPYLVGALIGDGTFSNIDRSCVGFTTEDGEMIDTLTERLPEGYQINHAARYGYRIVDTKGRRGPGIISELKRGLRALKLSGCKAEAKFIPDVYKFGSPETRLEMLRGLMDTDGWVGKKSTNGNRKPNHSTGFVSISPQLIKDVVFLVQSLGGTARVTSIPAGYRKFPESGWCHTKAAQSVAINLPMNPFRLTRKAERWKPNETYRPARSIVSVETCGFEETQCISVDAPDRLYVTKDCVVTHNTGMYLVDEAAKVQHQESVDAALSATSNCRQFVSTPNGSGNAFATKVMEWPEHRVFRFHWRDDPRKDDAWYQKQVDELDPVTLAQEVDMDFNASVEGVIIPQEHVQSALDAHTVLGIDPSGERRAALDVADEGIDNNAWATARGVLLDHIEEWSGKGSNLFKTTVKAFGLCDQFEIDEQIYDADGMGAHMKGDAEQINLARKADAEARHAVPKAIRTSPFWGSGEVTRKDAPIYPGAKRTNGDYYENLKAQSWGGLQFRFRETWRARNIPDYKYDPNDIISISSSISPRVRNKLMMELSQPTWGPGKTGKMIVNKKPDVDGRKAKSPNMADVVMMLYGAARRRMTINPEAVRRA